MKNLITVTAFLFLAACGKKASNDPVEKLFSDYGAAKDRMCACADKACADKTLAEGEALESNAKKTLGKPTKEQEERFEKLEQAFNDCYNKAANK